IEYTHRHGFFLTYWKELEILGVRFYDRRLRSLHRFGNKKRQLDFFLVYRELLDQVFPGWKLRFRNIVYRNSVLLSAYVLTPNFIKKTIRAAHISRKKMMRKRVLYAYFRQYMPLKRNQVLFISYSGAAVGDSPLYMARQLVESGQHDIVFATRYMARDRLFCRFHGLPFKLVDIRSWDYVKKLATSEFVITNSRVPTYF